MQFIFNAQELSGKERENNGKNKLKHWQTEFSGIKMPCEFKI